VTLLEAVKQRCWECHKLLKWNGYAGYEHTAECCGYIYTLKPRVEEYDFEVSKVANKEYTEEELKRFKESGVIPGKDGGLFHHPV
jgi:hypothetical protein